MWEARAGEVSSVISLLHSVRHNYKTSGHGSPSKILGGCSFSRSARWDQNSDLRDTMSTVSELPRAQAAGVKIRHEKRFTIIFITSPQFAQIKTIRKTQYLRQQKIS